MYINSLMNIHREGSRVEVPSEEHAACKNRFLTLESMKLQSCRLHQHASFNPLSAMLACPRRRRWRNCRATLMCTPQSSSLSRTPFLAETRGHSWRSSFMPTLMRYARCMSSQCIPKERRLGQTLLVTLHQLLYNFAQCKAIRSSRFLFPSTAVPAYWCSAVLFCLPVSRWEKDNDCIARYPDWDLAEPWVPCC